MGLPAHVPWAGMPSGERNSGSQHSTPKVIHQHVTLRSAESLCLKGYQEGKLKGLQSGQKSYWDMEKERDAALKKASNARHAAIRRQRKALRAPKPIPS